VDQAESYTVTNWSHSMDGVWSFLCHDQSCTNPVVYAELQSIF